MEIPLCSPVSVGREMNAQGVRKSAVSDDRVGQVMPVALKGGETGTLQSTQRLVLLLQQQEEERVMKG